MWKKAVSGLCHRLQVLHWSWCYRTKLDNFVRHLIIFPYLWSVGCIRPIIYSRYVVEGTDGFILTLKFLSFMDYQVWFIALGVHTRFLGLTSLSFVFSSCLIEGIVFSYSKLRRDVIFGRRGSLYFWYSVKGNVWSMYPHLIFAKLQTCTLSFWSPTTPQSSSVLDMKPVHFKWSRWSGKWICFYFNDAAFHQRC